MKFKTKKSLIGVALLAGFVGLPVVASANVVGGSAGVTVPAITDGVAGLTQSAAQPVQLAANIRSGSRRGNTIVLHGTNSGTATVNRNSNTRSGSRRGNTVVLHGTNSGTATVNRNSNIGGNRPVIRVITRTQNP